MLSQETIKTVDYPCCRKLGTSIRHRTRSRTRTYNKEVIILRHVFCGHCSTIEGESELSRNKYRTTYNQQQQHILYLNNIFCTFTQEQEHTLTSCLILNFSLNGMITEVGKLILFPCKVMLTSF